MHVTWHPNEDLFDSVNGRTAGTHAIVNATNCLGVMGAGLARSFAERYPAMEAAYITACREGRHMRGVCHVYPESGFYIINFPSKPDFRVPSTIADIREALGHLFMITEALQLTSIAVPMLGAGLGGLAWSDVRATILYNLAKWEDEADENGLDRTLCEWMIYGPEDDS